MTPPPVNPRDRRSDRSARRLALTGGAALAVIALIAVAVGACTADRTPPDPSSGPPASGAPIATPDRSAPVATDDGEYDAVFDGDPTGQTDVTEALAEFLSSNDGRRVALEPGAIYRVTQVVVEADDLQVDFRGAQLRGVERGVPGILMLRACTNIVLNDPSVTGTGYEWIGGDDNPDQFEHGIRIDGGSRITLNQPVTRDVRGDGIYVGYEAGLTLPATAVVINDADLARSSRNGIAPVAGEVTIVGGTIHDSGLHGVDFEPNNDDGARSIVGVVRDVDIRRAEGLYVFGLTGYAIAGAGFSSEPKPSLLIEGLTGDELDMSIYYTTSVVIRDNVSDTQATAGIWESGEVTFTGNVRISRP